MKFYEKQTRIALKNCDINPENIDDYIAYDGYQALYKGFNIYDGKEVIDEIKKSGGSEDVAVEAILQVLSEEATAKVDSDQKYIFCNADEGSGSRELSWTDPYWRFHSMYAAMAIGGYT